MLLWNSQQAIFIIILISKSNIEMEFFFIVHYTYIQYIIYNCQRGFNGFLISKNTATTYQNCNNNSVVFI